MNRAKRRAKQKAQNASKNATPETVTETMVQVAPGVWAMEGKSDVYNYVKHTEVPVTGGNNGRKSTVHSENETYEIWCWGTNNLLPNDREQLIMDNNLVHELTATKMAVVEGSSRYFYRENFEGEKTTVEVPPPAWWIALEESTKKHTRMDFDELFEKVLKNLFCHANAPVEFVRKVKGELSYIEAWECRHWRSGLQNEEGFVNEHFWCGDWSRTTKPVGQSKKFKNAGEEFPIRKTPAYNYDEDDKQAKFIVHIMDTLLHDDYYAIPGWWGSRKWVATANKIPVFHESNIDNGYFIKLHVEMPKDYFDDKTIKDAAKTGKELEEYNNRIDTNRAAFMKKVNNLFTGADGNKVLYTEYEMNKSIGKDYPGIKINVLETNKLDESMLKLFNSANEAVISAQGVHPALASIQTQGKLSSGSELRNALNVYTAIKAPRYRRFLSRIYDIACKINAPEGERDIKMGFKDIVVTNLDENKAGQKVKMGEE